MRRSLTTRLLLSHLLATASALLLLGGTIVFLIGRNQRLEVTAELNGYAALLATYASDLAPTTAVLEGVADTIARRFPAEAGTRVRIFAPNGSRLTTDASLGDFPSRAVEPLIISPAPILPFAPETRRFVAQPIMVGEQMIGIVEVSTDGAAERRLVRMLLLALIPGAVLALGGASLLATLLARNLVRPLHGLRSIAGRIAAGTLDARADDRRPDEIGQLARQVNRMAEHLALRFDEVERLAATRREFYRSVSHELRTPLTAIRGLAENLEDTATGEQRESLALLQAETARLQRLVEELLAGGEAPFIPRRTRQEVDIAALVAEVVELMRPRAERAGVNLRYSGELRAALLGDDDRLKQVVVNLLDNALKWSEPGGTVSVRCASSAQNDRAGVTIAVNNTGTDIPPELRTTLWRRGSHGVDGGEGLGLALVRDVVEAHGGQARLVDGPGTTFEVWLPLAAGEEW